MIQNNNLSVLPFYTALDEQNHRKSYAYGETYPLYSPSEQLLPFQILIEHSAVAFSVTDAYVYRFGDNVLVANIKQELLDGGLQRLNFAQYGYDVIIYPSFVPMGVELLEGRYYVRLRTSVGTFYSEVFTVVDQLSPYLKIEWWSEEDLVGDAWRIVYPYNDMQFKNRLYLCTELGKPDYEFEEEGEQRDGFYFPEKQISEKTYRFTILAPEYLCDVMRFIRMADNIVITDKYGRQYRCDTFLMTPKWQTQGDLASVECEFTTDTVAKVIGHALPPRGQLGAYNQDYNDDYDITNI